MEAVNRTPVVGVRVTDHRQGARSCNRLYNADFVRSSDAVAGATVMSTSRK